MSRVNRNHGVLERGARAAQATLQATHLHDAALEQADRFGIAQARFLGQVREQLARKGQ